MKHFPFLLSLAAGLGTACILGGFSAAADSAGVTVPVATETTQPSGNWGVTEAAAAVTTMPRANASPAK